MSQMIYRILSPVSGPAYRLLVPGTLLFGALFFIFSWRQETLTVGSILVPLFVGLGVDLGLLLQKGTAQRDGEVREMLDLGTRVTWPQKMQFILGIASLSTLVFYVIFGVQVGLEEFPSVAFFTQIAVYVLYFLLLRPYGKRLLNGSAAWLGRVASQLAIPYKIDTQGIELYFTQGFKKENARAVRISFNELTNVQVLKPGAMDRYLQLSRAVSIKDIKNLLVRSYVDMDKWLKGNGERPSYYQHFSSVTDSVLLLQGPSVLYIVNIPSSSGEDIIQMFAEQKRA